jgi:hypothetical protein
MPTMYQPGGVQRVQIQRVDPDNSLSTIFKGLGAGVQQGYGMKADQNAAEAARLDKAQGILAGAPPPTLPGAGLSTTMSTPPPPLPAATPLSLEALGLQAPQRPRPVSEMLSGFYGMGTPFL